MNSVKSNIQKTNHLHYTIRNWYIDWLKLRSTTCDRNSRENNVEILIKETDGLFMIIGASTT
jgi:hypothetical protein